jgi:hypothetical protein
MALIQKEFKLHKAESIETLSNYDLYNIDSPQHYATMQLNCCYGQ